MSPRRRSALALAASIVLTSATALVALGASGRAEAEAVPPPSLPALLVPAPVTHAPLVVARPNEPPPDPAKVGESVPVVLTAYCLTGTTREGRPVRPGLIAADPRVFPLGRYVNVFVGDQYRGRYYVGDTGRLIKGTVMDIWMPSCRDAKRFGRRKGWAVLLPEGASDAP